MIDTISRDYNLLCIICSIVFSKIPFSLSRLHPNYSMPSGQPISTIIGWHGPALLCLIDIFRNSQNPIKRRPTNRYNSKPDIALVKIFLMENIACGSIDSDLKAVYSLKNENLRLIRRGSSIINILARTISWSVSVVIKKYLILALNVCGNCIILLYIRALIVEERIVVNWM